MKTKRFAALLALTSVLLLLPSGCDKETTNGKTGNGETVITVEIPTSEETEDDLDVFDEKNDQAELVEGSEETLYYDPNWSDDYGFYQEASYTLCSDKDQQVWLGYAQGGLDIDYRFVLVTYDSNDGMIAYYNHNGHLEEYDLEGIEDYRNNLLTPELFHDYPALTDFMCLFCEQDKEIDTVTYTSPLADGDYYGAVYAISDDFKYVYAAVSNNYWFCMDLDDFNEIKVGETVVFHPGQVYKVLEITDDKIMIEGGFIAYSIDEQSQLVDMVIHKDADSYEEFAEFVRIPVADDYKCSVTYCESWNSDEKTVYEDLTILDALNTEAVQYYSGCTKYKEGGYGTYLEVEPLTIVDGECTSINIMTYED